MNEFLLMMTSMVIVFFVDDKVTSGQLIAEFLVNGKKLLVTKSHSLDRSVHVSQQFLPASVTEFVDR